MRTFITIIAILVTATTAHAEDESSGLDAFADAEYQSGEIGGVTITRGGIGLGLRYRFTERASAYLGLRAGMMRLGFDAALAQGLSSSGSMWTPFEPAGRFGVAYVLLLTKRYRLAAIGEFEVALPGIEPKLADTHIRTTDGAFDTADFGEELAHPEVFWNRVSVGAAVSVRLGNFEPAITVTLEHIDATIDVRLTQDTARALHDLGYDGGEVEGSYSTPGGIWLVPFRPEIGYHLSHCNKVALGGTIAAGAGLLFGGQFAYEHEF